MRGDHCRVADSGSMLEPTARRLVLRSWNSLRASRVVVSTGVESGANVWGEEAG